MHARIRRSPTQIRRVPLARPVRTGARPRLLSLFSLIWLLATVGCGSLKDTVRGLGRSAVQGIADELPNMRAPLQKTLHDTLLGDEVIQQAAQRITAATMHGIDAGLADPSLHRHLDELIAEALKTVGEHGSAATRQVLQTAGPELKEALRQIVLQTVAAASGALRDAVSRDLTQASQQLARGTAEALVTALVKALEGPLGQQLQQTAGLMGQRLASETAAGLASPASKAAAAEFTHSAVQGALRGARAGLDEGLPDRLQIALIAAAVVLAALVLLLGLGILVIYRRYKKSTKSLAIIAEKINQQDATDLKRAIRRSADDNYVGPWLSGFLKERGL